MSSRGAERYASAPHNAIVFVRATADEKKRITARAKASGLSSSRYLVRLATEGRSPPTLEERQRVETFLYLVRRAGLAVTALRANAAGMRLVGATAPVVEELREAERLLRKLAEEIGRRL